MMREEFEALLPAAKANDLTEQEYKQIEFVYTYHPLNLSKEDTADLYTRFGIGIFRDMTESAQLVKTLEQKVADARLEYERACTEHDHFLKHYNGIYQDEKEVKENG